MNLGVNAGINPGMDDGVDAGVDCGSGAGVTFGECHSHLFMNGYDYHAAVQMHRNAVNKEDVQKKLAAYRDAGITFLREGGDHMHVGEYAKTIAADYGIDLRIPVHGIFKKGHYGRVVGCEFETMEEYHRQVLDVKKNGGDFIKIMISGILDFATDGHLSCESLGRDDIREMIHIAHEEGFAVMAHTNGARAVENAADAGVDSLEHGNFADEAALQAMAENHTIWVPTVVTVSNLIGDERFPDQTARYLHSLQKASIRRASELGVTIAAGSDAGAYRVPHVQGIHDEVSILIDILANPEKQVYDGPALLNGLEPVLNDPERTLSRGQVEKELAFAESEIRRRFRAG